MNRFLDYVYEQNFFTVEDSAYFFIEATEQQIKDYKPKDGKWVGLDSNRGATFFFNVEGDSCGTPQRPCYHVSISGDDHDPNYGVSIAFQRGSSYGESQQDVPAGVLLAVQKAIYDYVIERNPAAIRWSPVLKQSRPPKKIDDVGPTGKPSFEDDTPPCPKDKDGNEKCRTKEEKFQLYLQKWSQRRKQIYENLTKQALFPNRYVSMEENSWIRRDAYDKLYVPHGYPALPEGLTDESSPAEKTRALEKMREDKRANYASIRRQDLYTAVAEFSRKEREESDKKRRERKLEKLKSFLEDEKQNPEKLKVGDVVELRVPADSIDDLERDDVTGAYWRNNTGLTRYFKQQKSLYGFDLRGKVEDFEIRDRDGDADNSPDENSVLYAKLSTSNEDDIYDPDSFSGTRVVFPVRDLKNEPSERASNIRTRKQETIDRLIGDRSINPNGLRDGDEVVINSLDPRTRTFGMVGQIVGVIPVSDRLWNHQSGQYEVENTLQFKIKWDAEKSLFPDAKALAGGSPERKVSLKQDPFKHLVKLTPAVEEEMKVKKAETVGLDAAMAARQRMERQLGRSETLQRRIAGNLERSRRLIDRADNPQRIKPGDQVRVVTAEEAESEGLQGEIGGEGGAGRDLAGRKGTVVDLFTNYADNIGAYVQITRSTMERRIPISLLRKEDESLIAQRQQRAERRVATRQRLMSGETTGGRNLGDMATVASGPHAGKRGRIVSWRVSGNSTYANIETMVTPQNPTGGRIQVNVRLLQPVQAAAPTEEPRTESANPFGFTNFIRWRNSFRS